MAISPISELSNMYANVSKTANTEGKAGSKVEATDFQAYMQDATAKNDTKDQFMDDLPVASDSTKIKKADDTAKPSVESKETSTADNNKQVNNSSDSLSTDHKDVKTVDAGATKELKDKIIDEAAKELGISEEDIVEVLSQLGIGAADLLNTENVSLLVASVTGDGDVLGILTDETAADMVLELNSNIEELLNTEADIQGITPELLKDLAIETAAPAIEVTESAVEAPVLVTENENNIKMEAPITEGENIVVSREVANTEVVDNTKQSDNDTNQQADDDGNNTERGAQRHDNTESIAQGVISSTMEAHTDSMNVTEVDNTMMAGESSQIDTIDIINQIQEHVRVEFKEDMTQLQMQLNPENLGTVNLTIAAKEGNVTAQLMTQNEAVQAALESQIAMLRESLEQQGVKVEAIEVTVASHGFEQNLEQGNDYNDQQEEANERLRKATRRIDINGIMTDEDIEALDESEQVTAKMMQADGNSMDYKV